MKIDIMPATIADAERLQNFYKNLLSENLPFIMDNPLPTLEQEIEFIKYHDGNNSLILLAVNNEEVVGMCNIRMGSHHQLSHTCFLLGISVAKHFRRLGIGAKLLPFVEDWCKDRSIRRLELEVVEGNPAVAFYQSLEYQIEGRKRCAIKVGKEFKDIIIMAKLFA
jgi:GNAT superfamily N-acetyltransferase